MSLERLNALVSPPDNPLDAGTPDQWLKVERELGTPLPLDYKQLVNLFGVGFFAHWIYVNSPFSSQFRLGEPGLLEFIVSGREEMPEYYHPFSAYPNPGGLLPWGGDDNTGLFCWRTQGPPEQWTTVSLDNHYSNEYREFPLSMTEFLAGWLAGQLEGDWFPEDIEPASRQVFTAGYRAT